MLATDDVTTDACVNSLYSMTCPACGDRKGEQKSLCYSCYLKLPGRLKSALYARVGHGYEEAVLESLNHLKAEKVHT